MSTEINWEQVETVTTDLSEEQVVELIEELGTSLHKKESWLYLATLAKEVLESFTEEPQQDKIIPEEIKSKCDHCADQFICRENC